MDSPSSNLQGSEAAAPPPAAPPLESAHLPPGVKPNAVLAAGGQLYIINTSMLSSNSAGERAADQWAARALALMELFDGPPAEAAGDAAGGLPCYESSTAAVDASSWAGFLAFAHNNEQPVDGPVKPLLQAAALLEAGRFKKELDCQLQRALLASMLPCDCKGQLDGMVGSLEDLAKLVVQYRLAKTAAALIPVLVLPGEEKDEVDDVTEDCIKAFDALDDRAKHLAFSLARMPPSKRAEEGLDSLFAAGLALEETLQSWTGKAPAGQEGRSLTSSQTNSP
ncbi:hypothetical protein ABPG75_006774 [Micractinium tetrahymenae]